MKNRRTFLMTMAAGLMALTVVIAPVVAEELLGVITKVDVENKKLTVQEKGGGEVEITTTDDTEFITPKGARKIDLEKIAKGVTKAQDAGKKGMPVRITHENKVASKIAVGKKAAPKKDE